MRSIIAAIVLVASASFVGAAPADKKAQEIERLVRQLGDKEFKDHPRRTYLARWIE